MQSYTNTNIQCGLNIHLDLNNQPSTSVSKQVRLDARSFSVDDDEKRRWVLAINFIANANLAAIGGCIIIILLQHYCYIITCYNHHYNQYTIHSAEKNSNVFRNNPPLHHPVTTSRVLYALMTVIIIITSETSVLYKIIDKNKSSVQST